MLEENEDLNESLDKKLKTSLKLRNSENFEKLCSIWKYRTGKWMKNLIHNPMFKI